MTYESSTKKARQINEAKLCELKPGIRAFIVIRIARLWKTILPQDNTFISTDFLAVDDQKTAMHGTIPADISENFENLLQEGHVYKIKMFQVTDHKPTHNAVPSKQILYFSTSTQIQEMHENIDNYPRHYFQFARMEDISERSDRHYFMTDVIGLLTVVNPITSVLMSPKDTTTNIVGQTSAKHTTRRKRDIVITLISGQTLKISIWEDIFHQLNIDDLLQHPTKPIIIVAGTTVKYFGAKYLSTSSATKIYINLNIPETVAIRKRFQNETSIVEVIPNDVITTEHTNVQNLQIEDLQYMNPREIKGHKFDVEAKIIKININKGWFYRSCSSCTLRVNNIHDSFVCNEHGPVTPKIVMRLNLILQDETEQMEAVIFGTLAEKLTSFQLTSATISQGILNHQLPEHIERIISREFIFTVGLPDQARDQHILNYKIFGFVSKTTPPWLTEKNKGKIAVGTEFEVINESSISLSTSQIPDDLFSEESPAKKLKHSKQRTSR